jgi:hypothetical protein
VGIACELHTRTCLAAAKGIRVEKLTLQ